MNSIRIMYTIGSDRSTKKVWYLKNFILHLVLQHESLMKLVAQWFRNNETQCKQ